MARKDSGATAAKPKKKRNNPFKQMVQVYKAVKTVDPKIGWFMLGAALLTLAVVVGIGWALGHPIYALILGLPLALLAATFVLSRRGDKAAYSALEGQPGAAGAALSGLRGDWYYTQEPVAGDVARGDLAGGAYVFRAVGRPGIMLIGDGPAGRCRKLMAAEAKKLNRVASGVPVEFVQVGDGEGQVPIGKLVATLMKKKPVLTKEEVAVVNRRLKSLGGIKAPVPAGMDPSKIRVDRRAMRGR
ncbi:DUF4191 domain-containing protein [Actinomycetota bacterium]